MGKKLKKFNEMVEKKNFDFSNCDMRELVLKDLDLRVADFTGSELQGISIRGPQDIAEVSCGVTDLDNFHWWLQSADMRGALIDNGGNILKFSPLVAKEY